MPGNQYDLYRFKNSDGSTKDWAVRANGDGSYTSRWGKTGARLQSKTFQNMLPMQDHIREKTNKGYKFIGMVFIDDDGKVSHVPLASSAKPVGQNPNPTQDEPRIYWRIKILPAQSSDIAVPFLQGQFSAFAQHILNAFPDCHWVQKNHIGRDFIKAQAGSLRIEDGIGSLLLLMATKKAAAAGISVTLSHDVGIEISDQLKLETQVLSFFDSNLESTRSIAETIGLLDKRIDLSLIETEVSDFYF